MDIETQAAADKVLSVAMCLLTLAVSRRKREEVLKVGYVVTSDLTRSREAHASPPGLTTIAGSSPAVLRLVCEKLRERSTALADGGLVIRQVSYGYPWFDISVTESPHEIVMKVTKIHPIKA